MKTFARKLARRAKAVPVLGRLVRIAIAVVRLPELRAEINALASGAYEHGPHTAQPALWRALNELRENTAGDANLTRSVPVALRRLTREVQALRQRLDAAGIDSSDVAAAARPPRLSVAPQHAAASPLRLYLGLGEAAPSGYIGAGLDDGAAAAPSDAAQEIRVAYVFETVSQAELRQHLLPQLYACLRPGGRLHVLAADAGATLAAYARGECGDDDLREMLYGGAGGDGSPRLNMLSPDSLGALLREAGFTVAATTGTGMRDGRAHTFDLAADKPAPAAAQ